MENQISEQPAATAADSTPSIEDRIGRLFGGDDEPRKAPRPEPQPRPEATPDDAASEQAAEADEPTSDAPAQDAAPDDGMDDLELDGELWRVPKKLKEERLRHEDYTRKTQETAALRQQVEYKAKALEAAESERRFAESVKDELSSIAQIDAQLKQFQQADWASMSVEDKLNYSLAQQQLERRRGEIDSQLRTKHGQFQEEARKAHSELVAKGVEALKRSIPNFSDSTVREIRDFAIRDGYSEQEVAGILDPRMVTTLWKAAQYEKLQSQKQQAKSTVQKAAPLSRSTPGSPPMAESVKSMLNYRKALQKAGPRGSPQRQAVAQQRIAELFNR